MSNLEQANTQEQHIYWMQKALHLAKLASALGEVPVGAVICKDNKLVSVGYNQRESHRNGTAHAELIAIEKACKALGGWRLHQCQLYVTLEPCSMCAGAIINTRIPTIVYGARDPKAGCFGSVADFRQLPFNHIPFVIGGVCQQEASQLLRDFFRTLRK